MRTTVDIDEEILRVVKDLASESNQSIGRVLSDLARSGLRYRASGHVGERNGIPLLAPRPDSRTVTSEIVKDLLERE